jgi:hypothetical protein
MLFAVIPHETIRLTVPVAMAYQEFVYSYLLEKGKEITRR